MIRLDSITIRNFKGIKKQSISLNGKDAFLEGDNATGKTTVYDAFRWCLFGKDHKGDAQFTIKPQDEHGVPKQKLENEVFVTLIVDDGSGKYTIEYGRTQREKWVKKRGNDEATFQGHEVVYTIDGVDAKKKDFEKSVSSLISEGVFKLITDPFAFNNLKWTERQSILFDIVDKVSLKEVAEQNKERFGDLIDKIKGDSIKEAQKKLREQIKKNKKELDLLPSRIDEANLAVPEEVDTEQANKKIAELKQKASDAYKNANNVSQDTLNLQKKQQELRKEHHALRNKEYEQTEKAYKEARRKYDQQLEDVRADNNREQKKRNERLTKANNALGDLDSRYTSLTLDKQKQQKHITELRKKWEKKQDEYNHSVSVDETACPTCGREYDDETIAERKENAIQAQHDRIEKESDEIAKQGKEAAEKLASIEQDIKELNKHYEAAKEEYEAAKKDYDRLTLRAEPDPVKREDFKADEQLLKQIQEKEAAIDELDNKIANSEDDEAKERALKEAESIELEIEQWQDVLSQDKNRKQRLDRVQELEDKYTNLGREIAAMERQEFRMEELNNTRIEAVEQRINDQFKRVRFRMFDPQINEGIKETCVTLVGGVPFPDANLAGQINAGMDIINTLSQHYQVKAPIFIDNRESVSILEDTESQTINLFKVKGQKTLTVKTD